MKIILVLLLPCLLWTFSACESSKQEMESMGADGSSLMEEGEDQQLLTEENGLSPENRKLIKEGHLSFETTNLAETRKRILQAVGANAAYIASDQESKNYNQLSHTLVIRVPADKFDKLLSEISAGVDYFDYKNVAIKDVTEEFLDIEARIKNKKELESRYLELTQQARTVTELLEIEKELGQLRSDIEAIEGRLNYLKNQVSLSTMTVTYYQQVLERNEFAGKFSSGFRNGWNNLVWFFIGLVNLWPFVLLLIVGIFAIRFYGRKSRSK